MCLFCFWLILVIWFAFHSELPTLSTLINRWWHDCQALMHSPVVLIFDGPWKRVKSMANTTKNMQRAECSGVTLPEYFRFPRPCPQVFTRPISCIWICYFISKNKFLLPPPFFFALFRWCCFFFLCCVWKGVWKRITSLEPLCLLLQLTSEIVESLDQNGWLSMTWHLPEIVNSFKATL